MINKRQETNRKATTIPIVSPLSSSSSEHNNNKATTTENKTGNNLKDLFLFCISVFLFVVSIQIILTFFSFVSGHEQTTMIKEHRTTKLQQTGKGEYTAIYKMVI
jgi:hypothetical protein